MRFKIDENLGSSTAELIRAAGHDVHSVFDERLSGATDEQVFSACCAEKRILISLDLDFTDPVRFPADRCGGIAVLRLPHRAGANTLPVIVTTMLEAMKTMSLEQNLWIVEPGRIRIHQPE